LIQKNKKKHFPFAKRIAKVVYFIEEDSSVVHDEDESLVFGDI
jgi:hypothetical protein